MHYLTIGRGDLVAAVEAKRSRFLAVVRRVDDEDAARALVAEQRRAHYAARHHCSAFVLGPGADTQRSSDDGEPAGTAGQPMLDVLSGRGLSDVAAVVTRYFGGTLLGAGGLVRAYSDAVAAAVDQARLVRRTRVELVELTLDHGDAGRVEGALRNRGVAIRSVAYGDAAMLTLATSDVPGLIAIAAELLSHPPGVRRIGHEWVDQD